MGRPRKNTEPELHSAINIENLVVDLQAENTLFEGDVPSACIKATWPGEYLILCPQDVELKDGRVVIKTGVTLKDGVRAIVLPTVDNALFGIKAENGIMLERTDVVPMSVRGEVRVCLHCDDDVLTSEVTPYGSTSRHVRLLAGTVLAQLIII
nr:MAG TPA: hypothetical protein [Caudoviricetes sp.]